MTNDIAHYRHLWLSGAMLRAATRCETVVDMATALGLTADKLKHAIRKLRDAGLCQVASPSDLIRLAHRTAPTIVHVDATNDAGHITKDPGAESRQGYRNLDGDMYPLEPEDGGDEWSEQTDPGMPMPTSESLPPLDEHRLKRRVRELEAENAKLMNDLLNTQDLLGVAQEAAQHRVTPLEMRERHSGRREAASLILISDNHVDEMVSPESVNGLNEHNPDIARARMARIFEGARWLTSHARQSHLVRDAIVWLGGDHISGTIHEDLRETNAMSLPESIAFAQQLIGDGLRHLLDDAETESIRVVCSTGNHGRLAPGKPRIHTRNETNAETILFLGLAREFLKESRITFDLPTGVFTYFDVYGRTVRASHGDHLKYGGALGGLTNPINRAVARMNMGRHADLDVFGHWHTLQDNGNWIVNGASVGYGTFSEWIHAPYERPQQAWALLDAKRWRSLNAPIWCNEEERSAA